MKSDRLISLLLLLQSRSPRSARELAGLLEVSARSIYRDVDALALSGVPVYAERGSAGGIALAEGYRKALTHFKTEELHALFLASADPLAELGVVGHRSALEKIAGALPDLQRRAAEQARGRVLLDHNRWYRAEQPVALLALFRRAIWDNRQVRLHYKDRAAAVTERIVDPFGLISKAGVWYLAARQADGALRTFRVERVTSAQELSSQFARDEAFDLEAYWRSSQAAMERPEPSYEATLHVSSDGLAWVMAYNDCEILDTDETGKMLRVRFPALPVAVRQVAGWGATVRVLAPPELKLQVVEHVRAVLDMYGTVL